MIDDNVTRKKQKVEEQELTSEPTPSPLRTDSCSLDDLLCIPRHAGLVLSLISIPELLLLGCTSRRMRFIHQVAEISRRGNIWCQSVSRCLRETYVDDPDSKLSDDSLESTDDSTSTEAANLKALKKESDYYNTLGKWCGGWPRLLHAEEQELTSEPTPSPLRPDSCSLDDLLCIPHHTSLVLSFLSIRELMLLGCTSRRMRMIPLDAEISRRRKMWCQSASRCLPEVYVDDPDDNSELSDDSLESTDGDPSSTEAAHLSDDDSLESTDDPTSTEDAYLSDDDSLEYTDDPTSTEDARLKTLQKESDYYNILAEWCGGWPRLLHAREAGAPLPPIGPPLSTPCENDIVLLWDIRCEGVWKWSGTQQLDRNQPGNMQEVSELFGLFRAFPFW
eukprot:CAMPEP_0194348490 /NCGR_PEP_ID=MMETSP0171-20130528/106563_1 /TAXON_ID=218684 /ORGANISM="Corethron pennatum, Strain L29A3" /LENGTH=390 /DNA_ID=CAMNT_0039115835 /DNA_START=830 /DNA_END=1999 /DNA_ORIENTATION=-